jgi:hypothetical protein
MPDTTDYQSQLLAYTDGKDPIAMQGETPRLLAELVDGVPLETLSARPGPTKWSVSEILAHLAEPPVGGTAR